MELIAAILLAGPAGYFARTRKRGLVLYLVVWTVIFPLQTMVVYLDTDPSGNDWLYWVVNAAILAVGIGLNLLGSRLGQQRRSRRVGAQAPALASSPTGRRMP